MILAVESCRFLCPAIILILTTVDIQFPLFVELRHTVSPSYLLLDHGVDDGDMGRDLQDSIDAETLTEEVAVTKTDTNLRHEEESGLLGAQEES